MLLWRWRHKVNPRVYRETRAVTVIHRLLRLSIFNFTLWGCTPQLITLLIYVLIFKINMHPNPTFPESNGVQITQEKNDNRHRAYLTSHAAHTSACLPSEQRLTLFFSYHNKMSTWIHILNNGWTIYINVGLSEQTEQQNCQLESSANGKLYLLSKLVKASMLTFVDDNIFGS